MILDHAIQHYGETVGAQGEIALYVVGEGGMGKI